MNGGWLPSPEGSDDGDSVGSKSRGWFMPIPCKVERLMLMLADASASCLKFVSFL